MLAFLGARCTPSRAATRAVIPTLGLKKELKVMTLIVGDSVRGYFRPLIFAFHTIIKTDGIHSGSI